MTDHNKESNKQHVIEYIEWDEVKGRFQVDLIQLSDYLHLERFLLNCDDHLSKYLCSRNIKNKTKEEVLK